MENETIIACIARIAKLIDNKFLNIFHRELTRINTKKEVLKEFKHLFLDYQCEKEGAIYLMSYAGGYPKSDPFLRINGLATDNKLTIYAAMSQDAFVDYAKRKPVIIKDMVCKENLKIYLFNDLTPYQYRIGVNTELKRGFFCGCFSKEQYDNDELEGFSTQNKVFIDAIIHLFQGLLKDGTEITSQNVSNYLTTK